MTTITRELIAAYLNGEVKTLTNSEQKELARIALASLEAEPDYISYDCGCCGWETIEEWRDNDVCPKCNHKPMGKTELFIAPPAPVEPLTDEQIDDVLDSRGNILYVIADKRERLRMFAREILRAAMGDKS